MCTEAGALSLHSPAPALSGFPTLCDRMSLCVCGVGDGGGARKGVSQLPR